MKAMIMAAGRGVRMQPLTDTTPKPLLQVAGKALIDWHLEKLKMAGFSEVVINVSHLAGQIVAHVGDGARFGVRVDYSEESTPLETGGGIATAVPLLGDSWFALISADVFSDIDYAALAARGHALRGREGHLELVPRRAGLIGEYRLEGNRARMIGADEVAGERYTWASIGVFRVAAFADMPKQTAFVLLPHFRRWCADNLLTANVHRGQWENLGTVAQFTDLNRRLHVNSSLVPSLRNAP
jgi:N-acetyl-alpha-D-muramate 1-phosphate uridylyltransferase